MGNSVNFHFASTRALDDIGARISRGIILLTIASLFHSIENQAPNDDAIKRALYLAWHIVSLSMLYLLGVVQLLLACSAMYEAINPDYLKNAVAKAFVVGLIFIFLFAPIFLTVLAMVESAAFSILSSSSTSVEGQR